MNDTFFNSEQYQENEFIKNELNIIFSSKQSGRKQYIALKCLLTKVNTPLAKNHVVSDFMSCHKCDFASCH